MLATRIIPCLDIKDRKVAKGVRFQKLKPVGDPVKLARKYYRDGADELVFLDIRATIEDRKTILDLVKEVASQIFIPLTVGGGIRSVKDAQDLFSAGAEKVAINTAIVSDPTLITRIADSFGSQSVVASIDAARTNNRWGQAVSFLSHPALAGWDVYVNAGTKPTDIDALWWAKEVERLGAGEILLTSIDRDGTMLGYDLELTSAVSTAVHIPVIASGGGGDIKSMVEVVTKGKADAILLASVLHFGMMGIQEIKSQLRLNRILVR